MTNCRGREAREPKGGSQCPLCANSGHSSASTYGQPTRAVSFNCGQKDRAKFAPAWPVNFRVRNIDRGSLAHRDSGNFEEAYGQLVSRREPRIGNQG